MTEQLSLAPLTLAQLINAHPTSVSLCACSFEQHGAPILAIFNHAILHTTALYEYRPRTLPEIKRWFDAKARADFPVIGLTDSNGLLLGFASYGSFRPQAAFLHSVEHSIYVQPDYQGRGLGKILLQAVIEAATRQHYRILIGAIDSSNHASIALHQQLAFQHSGTLHQVAYKFERWLDLAFYQRLLATDD